MPQGNGTLSTDDELEAPGDCGKSTGSDDVLAKSDDITATCDEVIHISGL